MAQLDADQYVRLTPEVTYGQSDGLYWDKTNSLLVMVINGAVVATINSSGDISAGSIEAPDLEVSGETRGDLLYRAAALWARLAVGSAGQVLNSNGTDPAWATISGDATMASGGALTVTDVTVGSDAAGDILYKSSASALARLAKGTNGQFLRMNAAGTLPAWSSDVVKSFSEDFNAYATTDQVSIILPSGAEASGAEYTLHHMYSPGGNIYALFPIDQTVGSAQTLLPSMVANGLDIGGDQADDMGYEVCSHYFGATGRPFVVGTDPAFYFTCKIEITDADGLDELAIGFRKTGRVQASGGDYDTYAYIGVTTAADPMAIKTVKELNGGGQTVVDSTQTVAGAIAVQFKVLVSAAGVVTFQHDIVSPGTLAAPTAVTTITFDAGDHVIPYVRFVNVAAAADNVIIHKWDAGYQV